MDGESLTDVMRELLLRAGLDASDVTVQPLAGGGNNRVFVVKSGNCSYLAKVYFSHPSDDRDRLGAEWDLLSLAWDAGLRCVPRPVASDRHHHLGLYEFVEGRKVGDAEVTQDFTEQALTFFVRLNDRRIRQHAGGLRNASEACFAIEDHLDLLDRRLQRLSAAAAISEIDQEAEAFVHKLRAAWRLVRSDLMRRCDAGALTTVLPSEDRCVSPSDFGFHNALLRPSGELCFIDFEYAGWDDPAKAVGDFFCQPAIPVPLRYFDAFVSHAFGYSSNPESLELRARLLLPVFQFKWCCIMLNEFLPDAAQRRRFADPGMDPERRKRNQLDKAHRYFQSTVGESWPT
ncbi:MAG: aminoglycoside phosphotransferase family protein [Burkholderiales bacterium]|nr:aminoglycoside phosphotransferase family protein [Burkholderiales bacterium]